MSALSEIANRISRLLLVTLILPFVGDDRLVSQTPAMSESIVDSSEYAVAMAQKREIFKRCELLAGEQLLRYEQP
jgi:hypothetical protein